MQLFITGTDTNVGKTFVSLWLAHQTRFSYFKPIQTGMSEGSDTQFIQKHARHIVCHKEIYSYQTPCSPHLAARYENQCIDWEQLTVPSKQSLIVEGAGGLFVPITQKFCMIHLIKKYQMPVILVARTQLGTFNHTLLSLQALQAHDIPVLAVCFNGPSSEALEETIWQYGDFVPIVFAPFNPLACVSDLIQQQLPQILLDLLLPEENLL